MKKFLLIAGMIFVTGIASANQTYYVSVKMGGGTTTIYQDNTKIDDYFVQNGFKYDASGGVLLEVSPAIGIDWALNTEKWLHLRLEAELGYNHYRENMKLKKDADKYDFTVKFDQVFFLANGYMDFRIDRFSPYVGLGFGYSWGDMAMRDNDDGARIPMDANGGLYALHFGLAYKYSDITTFDLGCRRVYAPAEDDGQYVFDSIRLGLRFRI